MSFANRGLSGGILRACLVAVALVIGCSVATAFAAPGPLDRHVGAIQTEIARANQEQAQGVASGGDPSVISDTATAPSPTRTAPPAVHPTPRPMVPAGQNTSHNWSGYAVAEGQYTGVTGTWIVPQPDITGGAGSGATWVGVGGVTSRDLIQAGTQDVTRGAGQVQFQAWLELLPHAAQQIPLAVGPGDSVTVSLNEQGAGSSSWHISVANNTSGQMFQTTITYPSSESSAEWIEEAPSGPAGILPLDNFKSVSFSGASVSRNDQSLDLRDAGAQPITLLNASDQPLAVPSAIGSDGSSFEVTRTSAPATTGGGRGPQPVRWWPQATTLAQ